MHRCRECNRFVDEPVTAAATPQPVNRATSAPSAGAATSSAPATKPAPVSPGATAKPIAERPSSVPRKAPRSTATTGATAGNNGSPATPRPANREAATRGKADSGKPAAIEKGTTATKATAAPRSAAKSVPAVAVDNNKAAAKKPLSYFQYRKYSKTLASKGLDKPRLADERRRALEELVEFADERIPGMFLHALQDDWIVVRETAARLLSRFSGEDVEAALIERLQSDDSLDVRRAAGISLTQVGTGASVMPLLQAGLDNPQQRLWTLDALSRMGNRAVQALLKCLTLSDAGIRLDAVIVLGRIADPTAAKPLLALLRDPSAVVRAHVAEALGNIGVVDYCEAIAQLLNEEDPGVRLNAAAALAKVADERVCQAVIGLLHDPDPLIRAYAATAAARAGAGAASSWGQVAQLLNEENEEVRARAAEALGLMGEPRAARILSTALSDQSVKVRQHATVSLGQLNCPDSVAGLEKAVTDPQPGVRKRALDALSQIGTPEAREVMAKVLRSDHLADVRQTAARVLAQFPSRETVEVLKESLSDEFMVRVRACISLGEIALPECADLLLPLLKDPVAEMRFHACNGIAAIGDTRALKSLEELIDDPDPLVLRGVGKALAALGDARGEEVLKKAAEIGAEQSSTKAVAKPAEKSKANPRDRRTSVNPLAMIGGFLSMLTPNALVGAISGAVGGLLSAPSAAGGLDTAAMAKPVGIAASAIVAVAAVYFTFFAKSDLDRSQELLNRGDFVTAGFVSSDKIVCTLSSGRREIYSASGRSLLTTVDGQPEVVQFMVSPDEKTLVAVIKDQTDLGLLNPDDLSETGKLSGHTQPPLGGVFHPDGKTLVTWDQAGTVIVWELSSKSARHTLKFATPNITAIGASANGSIAAVGTSEGKVFVKNIIDGTDVSRATGIQAHKKPVSLIAFGVSGERMITGSQSELIYWNVPEKKKEKTLGETVFGTLAAVRFLKDDKRAFVLGGRSGIIDLENNTGKPIKPELENGVEFVSLSPDEKYIVGGNPKDLAVELFDAATGDRISSLSPF